MGDADDRAGEFFERLLEPRDRLGVQVIRRFVEEQEVRLLEKDAAERDAALLTTGELGDIGIAGRQAKRVHRNFDSAIELPGVVGVDLVLKLALLFEHLVHLIVVHRLSEFFADGVEAIEKVADRLQDRARHCL